MRPWSARWPGTRTCGYSTGPLWRSPAGSSRTGSTTTPSAARPGPWPSPRAWRTRSRCTVTATARSSSSPRLGDGAERGRGAVLSQRLGDRDRAALVLEVLHDRQWRAGGRAGAVERVHELQAAVAAVPDVQPPGLVVGGVRAGGDLPVPLLRREPGLDVVFLGGGRAKVADRDVHDPVRQAQGLGDLFLVGQQPLVELCRLLGNAVDVHLYLVELVHPEHAAGVLARRPGLTPEVGG